MRAGRLIGSADVSASEETEPGAGLSQSKESDREGRRRQGEIGAADGVRTRDCEI